MKVFVDIHNEDVEGDYGWCDGLRVTCERCGHYVEVPGTSGRSAGHAAFRLREECPRGESNFYDTDWWQ